MKENQHVQPVIDIENRRVIFKIADGGPDEVLEWDLLHADVQMHSGLAGMAQVRVVDKAAIKRADDDGNVRSAEEMIRLKRAAIHDLIEHYHTGTPEWNVRVSSGGGAQSITLLAIAQVKRVSYEEAGRLVDAYASVKHGGDRKKALAFLAKGSQVREAMEQIRVKRAGEPKVDADQALSEI